MNLENKNFWKIISLLAIIILPIFFYLTIKATQINGWDSWTSGSAQTILTARYWARDGFLKHKLYFIPSGYYENIEFLDKPEFRFLAWGTATGELIGKRLYYTHYPSGYLIPYGLLAKAGAESRFWFRMLAICFSFASIFFLFGFVYLITNKNHFLALIAVFYYSTSITFLRYADSLANQPVDDLFKWAILFFSIYALGREDIKGRLEKLIWLLYFLLAASSYDSTFFIFFWLCALGYIVTKKINIKKYLFWASAPVLAFILQIAQNTWYLGWKDAWLDLWGTFLTRFNEVPSTLSYLPLVSQKISSALSVSGFLLDLRTRWALPVLAATFFLVFLLLYRNNKIISKTIIYYLAVLGLGGLIYGWFFPGAGAGSFGYQGRQLAPMLLVIISLATFALFKAIKNREIKTAHIFLSFFLFIIWFAHFQAVYSYVREWPNDEFPANKVHYWQELNRQIDKDTIILSLKEDDNLGPNKFVTQVYVDRLILFFDNSEQLFEYSKKITAAVPEQKKFLIILPKNEAEF